MTNIIYYLQDHTFQYMLETIVSLLMIFETEISITSGFLFFAIIIQLYF